MSSTPQEVDATQTQVVSMTRSTTHNQAITVTQHQALILMPARSHAVVISVVQVQV